MADERTIPLAWLAKAGRENLALVNLRIEGNPFPLFLVRRDQEQEMCLALVEYIGSFGHRARVKEHKRITRKPDPAAQADTERIALWRAEGQTWKWIGKQLGISWRAAMSRLKRHKTKK